MVHYCPGCKKAHQGWPNLTCQYPQEYIDMNNQDRELKCFILHDGLKIEQQKGHVHYYTQALWPQKVKEDEDIWYFKVWVMIKDIKAIKYLNAGVIDTLDGNLHNRLPWYIKDYLNYPVTLKWHHECRMPIVTGCKKEEVALYNDFMYGLPNKVARRFCDDILRAPQFRCDQ